jgi:opacity protein-like surface antigen
MLVIAVSGLAVSAGRSSAQAIDLRFVALDMYGGAAWPTDSETGVAFGGRLSFADLFDRFAAMGFSLDWWAAGRAIGDLEVRDISGGFDFWLDVLESRTLKPYLGVGVALHSFDTSRKDGSPIPDGQSPEAEMLDGVKFGGSGYAGLTLRITQTGAIWVIAEYRYNLVSNLSYHELRVGLRLTGAVS